jgi:glycosyltransferase involved in cell wall biosynthesis
VFFSVIIPTYNRAGFIEQTIRSVINQDFNDWECIVIDDGSVDNTASLVKNICKQDKRVKYIYQDNAERGAARNNGINNSEGSYICFLDSDDAFLPNHLSELYLFIINNDKSQSMIFSNSLIEEEGKTRINIVPKLESSNVYSYLLHYTPNPARVCIEREIFKEFSFDQTIPGIEDLDLWLHIAVKYPVLHLEKDTTIYKVHNEMYSVNSFEKISNELRMYKYVFSKPFMKNQLPKYDKNRLLSKCHFFLSCYTFDSTERIKSIKHAIISFLLYPKGYNGKTNKILLVNILYSIPIFGFLLKKSIQLAK